MGKGLKYEWKEAERKANHLNKKEKKKKILKKERKTDKQVATKEKEKVKELKGEIYDQYWERGVGGIEKIKRTKRKAEWHICKCLNDTHKEKFAFLLWAINIFFIAVIP